jgi:hypothetical protein
MPKIITHAPNGKNNLKNSKVIIKVEKIVDEFEVPKHDPVAYCNAHPSGYYGKRFAEAVKEAERLELKMEEGE